MVVTMSDIRETSLNYVESAFDAFNDAIENAVMDNQESLALDLYGRITNKNPVQSGRSRAAWNISVNSVDTSIPKEKPKVKNKNGDGFLVTYKPKSVSSIKRVPYSTIFITNNLPYILKLEDGSSQQSPMGMVAVSVEEVYIRAQSGF